MADDHSSNIKVCIRVRPENQRERAQQHKPVVCVIDNRMLVFDPNYDEEVTYFHGKALKDPTHKKARDVKFAFDHVFSPSSTNIEVYEQTTKPILASLLDGFNCSVFAYGATGAGKTFSMLGSAQTPGVIFLSMMDLYNIKESEKDLRTIDISVSYLEVYNENIKDLLTPGSGNLPIRDNGKSGVVVPGLTLMEPQTAEQLLQMLERGNKNRTQHPTDANSESSRSHAVFQVFISVRSAVSATLSDNVKSCKLSLIDLAGSERATVSKNHGARLREGANINKSLLALGNCINALADTKRRGSKHIPYRNSKLTRILKDSLGENCKTVMIAAVSPARASYEDTFNTLSYADRAKKIKVVLKQNVLNVNAHIHSYGKVVDDLHTEVAALKEALRIQTEKAALAERLSVKACSTSLTVPVTAESCDYDIASLQTDLSVAYGRRRSLRDKILDLESTRLHIEYSIANKLKMLRSMEEAESGDSQSETELNRTKLRLNKSIQSGRLRCAKLEEELSSATHQLAENERELSSLVRSSQDVHSQHAQQVLSLQMKCYHYEQESRENAKLIQHLVRHVESMSEDKADTQRPRMRFRQFVEETGKLLTDSGLFLGVAELKRKYDEATQYLRMSDGHIRFTCPSPQTKAPAEESNDIYKYLYLPVVDANHSSLAISGQPIQPHRLDSVDADVASPADVDCALAHGIDLPIASPEVPSKQSASPLMSISPQLHKASASCENTLSVTHTQTTPATEQQGDEVSPADSTYVIGPDEEGEQSGQAGSSPIKTALLPEPAVSDQPGQPNDSTASSPGILSSSTAHSRQDAAVSCVSGAPLTSTINNCKKPASLSSYYRPVYEVLQLAPSLTINAVVRTDDEETTPHKRRRVESPPLQQTVAIELNATECNTVNGVATPRGKATAQHELMETSYSSPQVLSCIDQTSVASIGNNQAAIPSYAEMVKSPAPGSAFTVVDKSSAADSSRKASRNTPGYLKSTIVSESRNNSLKRKLGQENWT